MMSFTIHMEIISFIATSLNNNIITLMSDNKITIIFVNICMQVTIFAFKTRMLGHSIFFTVFLNSEEGKHLLLFVYLIPIHFSINLL